MSAEGIEEEGGEAEEDATVAEEEVMVDGGIGSGGSGGEATSGETIFIETERKRGEKEEILGEPARGRFPVWICGENSNRLQSRQTEKKALAVRSFSHHKKRKKKVRTQKATYTM